ncbi:substrate-binding and VWA domain-containing protein [Catellatospora sichuanensis]|uniref:substrate-binding and VWA domain-containing protein n=1 Tax=Catellatospora sichuanensis TaxID=1969805 RepID=UPI0011845BE6|nr:substrate-binding and VWA domain-containing protein [Catellatospora sichuanensis]
MPNGRNSTVRSHRRGGGRRRSIAPWIVIPTALVLIGSGVTIGYVYVIKDSCSGSTQATVVAAPGTASLLKSLAGKWAETNPSVDGVCASVTIGEQDTAATVRALAHEWNAAVSGPAPDVWVPPSSAWVKAAAAGSEDADRILPDLLPSVARTPVVIAMPKAAAEKLGWPDAKLDWKDLLDKLAQDSAVKVGMSDPGASTAGLLALSAIIDADDNTEVDPTELGRVFALEQRMALYKTSTEELFAEYVSSGGKAVNAFPALEQDVVRHNAEHPDLPLVAVYPKNATTEADNPYLVLKDAAWTNPQRVGAAEAFLGYLRGDAARSEVQKLGYRDSNRQPGPQLSPANGVISQLTALPGGVLLTESITKTRDTWTALTRPTNMLLVLDVSGSMGGVVRGTGGQTKLDLTKSGAQEAVNMFGDDAQVGLWSFSSQQSGSKAYKELVPLGKLTEEVSGKPRRDQLTSKLKGLEPGGNTGMYDTVWAAYQTMQKNYVPGATNMIVLLSDGADDDQLKGLKLEQLVEKINAADKQRPVKVVTIALGKPSNSEALAKISAATGVSTYSSERSYDIGNVLRAAIFDYQ